MSKLLHNMGKDVHKCVMIYTPKTEIVKPFFLTLPYTFWADGIYFGWIIQKPVERRAK